MFIRNENRPVTTEVSNIFIDRYMAGANGEFVKVYLYLLRLAQQEEDVSIAMLADRLNHTENDVMRALRYWEKLGILRQEKDGLQLVNVERNEDAGPEPEKVERKESGEKPVQKETEISAVAAKGNRVPMDELRKNEEFRQVLFVAETYLGRTLSPRDIELFAYLYDELKFPEDLLEYLVEYCVGGGHRSLRYIESVALGWHREGKMTVRQAKDAQKAYSKENKQVMKAFGIAGRVLTPKEREAIERWLKEYHLPLDVIVEGCNVTMKAIHQPSFEYTEKILDGWRQAGIRTVEEARAHRENRRTDRTPRSQSIHKREDKAVRNRFRNYEQREVDYDDLLNRDGISLYT